MTSLKMAFLALTFAFLLFLFICIALMVTAEGQFQCERKENKIYKDLGETVDCHDVIKRYTTDVPLLLGLFGLFHVLIYFIWLCLSNQEKRPEKPKNIFALFKLIIILGTYAGVSAYIYFVIFNFGREEGSYLQAIPQNVPCSSLHGTSMNYTVEIGCHLETPTRINNSLLFLLIMTCVILMTFFYEVYDILSNLIIKSPAQHLYNTI